jgi:hypothetical protein
MNSIAMNCVIVVIFLSGLFNNYVRSHPFHYITDANCGRKLEAGQTIMGKAIVADTSTTSNIVVTRNGVAVLNSGFYFPSETLDISASGGFEYAVDVNQGTFSVSNAANLGCSSKRYHNTVSSTLQLPVAGSGDVTIALGYASAKGAVTVQSVTLKEGQRAPTVTPTSTGDSGGVAGGGPNGQSSTNGSYSENQKMAVIVGVIGILLFLVAFCCICNYHMFHNHKETGSHVIPQSSVDVLVTDRSNWDTPTA